MSMTPKDRQDLADLIAKAKQDGKWLYCHYQSLWFSPDKLSEYNAKGEYLWGVVNWQLRDPKERLAAAEARAKAANDEVDRIRKEIG